MSTINMHGFFFCFFLAIGSMPAREGYTYKAASKFNEDGIATCQDMDQPSRDIKDAIRWLVKNVESFFRDYGKNKGDFSYLCTKEYAEFKTDATNVEMGEGLNQEAFETKWKDRIGPYAGINVGFMISGQDFGKIEVVKCEFAKRDEKGRMHFNVLINDIDFKVKYLRTVILLKSGKSFLIDDVLEISEEFGK